MVAGIRLACHQWGQEQKDPDCSSDLERKHLFSDVHRVIRTRNGKGAQGVEEFWERLEALFRTKSLSFKDWLIVVTNARLDYTTKHAEFGRTVMIEILQNHELRDAMQALWAKLMWDPVVEYLKELQGSGQIRKNIDIEMLARAIHCMQIGYSLTRFVFAPDRKWHDADEIEKMADLLTFGSSKSARRGHLREA